MKPVNMPWPEVMRRVHAMIPNTVCTVYGVPRGGAVVAGLMHACAPDRLQLVSDPASADIIVDDIVDTGTTRARVLKELAERGRRPMFVALVDKTIRGDQSWIRFPWEEHDVTADIADTVIRQLQAIGEDPMRPGLKDTPKRYIKALMEMTAGLRMDPKEPLARVFDENHDEIVMVQGIDFVSLCEHHLLPFSGTVDFAYLPKGKVVGLSKIPRFIRILAQRPQVQERLTTEIADTFCEVVEPAGVMVVVRGVHSCMRYRGVRSDGNMLTSVVRGVFKDEPEARAEAMKLMESTR